MLSPSDVKPTQDGLEVLCTLNPAATRFNDEIILLVRVGERPVPKDDCVQYLYFNEDSGKVETVRIPADDSDLELTDARCFYYRGKMLLSSMSHLRVARGTDGENFTFDERPAIFPANAYESYGCEDARITFIDSRYYITYTAVSDRGVTVALASTDDFVNFQRHGIIFPPYNKDAVIFPQKIRGRYACRLRPYRSEFNQACIWTAWSPDLVSWGDYEMTMAPEADTWMSDRVGCGGTPIRTDDGWLEIFHAADDNGRYCLGAMLSELDSPQRVIARSSRAVFEPQAEYETRGVYGNCVFSNGVIADPDGKITVYYGAADKVCAAATTTIDQMVAAAKD